MEVELKMAFPDRASYETFISDPWKELILPAEKTREIIMHSRYYDTQARDLDPMRATVRVRLENNKAVLTLKRGDQISCGIFRRQEWSVRIPSEQLSALQPMHRLDSQLIRDWFEREAWYSGDNEQQTDLLNELLDRMEGQTLICTAEIRFTRLAALVEINGSQLETALDQGYYVAGQDKKAFTELEIECLAGDSSTLDYLRKRLADKFGLIMETESKLARCLAFARSRGSGF